jgi:hypothetical protein
MSATQQAPSVRASAARSFDIVLKNVTNLEFTFKSSHLDHGIWTVDGSENLSPPKSIDAMSRAHIASESQGFMTGCEGTVVYSSSAGELTIYFDNPYAGSNGFSVKPPPGYSETHTDISGNNAAVTVTLTPNV